MAEFCIKVFNKDGEVLAQARGTEYVNLCYSGEYAQGDTIAVECSSSAYAWLSLDDALGKSLVYLTGNVSYQVPFGEKSESYHEMTFEERVITWVEMHDMKKADDPSPFPALTQIEVYGREA